MAAPFIFHAAARTGSAADIEDRSFLTKSFRLLFATPNKTCRNNYTAQNADDNQAALKGKTRKNLAARPLLALHWSAHSMEMGHAANKNMFAH